MSKKPKPKKRGPHWGANLRCLTCGDTIQSAHVHDFRSCKCGAISIDGGAEYCRMIGKDIIGDKPAYEVIDPGNYRA